MRQIHFVLGYVTEQVHKKIKKLAVADNCLCEYCKSLHYSQKAQFSSHIEHITTKILMYI